MPTKSQESKLVHNERIRYAANFINNLGVALLLAGAFAPLFKTGGTPADWEEYAGYTIMGFVGAVLSIGVVQFWLSGLRE